MCSSLLSVLSVAVTLGFHKPVTPDDLPSQLAHSLPQYEAYAVLREAGLAGTQMRWAQLLPG